MHPADTVGGSDKSDRTVSQALLRKGLHKRAESFLFMFFFYFFFLYFFLYGAGWLVSGRFKKFWMGCQKFSKSAVPPAGGGDPPNCAQLGLDMFIFLAQKKKEVDKSPT